MSWWHQTHGVGTNVGFVARLIYWPGMTKDVELHIVRCDQCIQFKSKPQRPVVENIQATHPLQSVLLDYITIEATEGRNDVHMLIITDHFVRYAQVLVTSSQTAKYTAKALWEWFVVHHGLPERIISDQGQNFKSDLISELCKLVNVWKLHISLNTHKQMDNWNGSIIH